MNIILNVAITVSDHATRRAQQRGVTREAIFWTALYGEPRRAAGGAIRRTMTRRSIDILAERGIASAALRRHRGTVIITCDDSWKGRHVLTVRPTEKSGKRRGGVHKPKYHGMPDISNTWLNIN